MSNNMRKDFDALCNEWGFKLDTIQRITHGFFYHAGREFRASDEVVKIKESDTPDDHPVEYSDEETEFCLLNIVQNSLVYMTLPLGKTVDVYDTRQDEMLRICLHSVSIDKHLLIIDGVVYSITSIG